MNAPRVVPSRTQTRLSSLKDTSKRISVKSTVRPSHRSRRTWLGPNAPQDAQTKNLAVLMEGRCGQTTATGQQCKNRLTKGCDACHLHGTTNQCSVCYSALLRNARTLPCGHAFHHKCIERWKRSCRGDPTCPMCRTPFDLPKYRVTISIQNVCEGTTESSQYVTSNIQGIQTEFGLDLRVLSMHQDSTMNIVFDLDESEDLREVLTALGIPRVSV